MQIVNPCPLARSHPGMLEGIPVFPLMEETPTDSRGRSKQRLVSQITALTRSPYHRAEAKRFVHTRRGVGVLKKATPSAD